MRWSGCRRGSAIARPSTLQPSPAMRPSLDLQSVAQRRHARLARRARGQPVLQRGQVEHRRIEFDAGDVEVLAAAAHRRPGHRDVDALRAQQRRRRAGFARDHVAHHQRRRAAQAVFAGAGGGDFQAQRCAEAVEHEAGDACGLQQRQRSDSASSRQQRRRPAARQQRAAQARGRITPPSVSGSSASTNASASNTRRSSGRSPMPA